MKKWGSLLAALTAFYLSGVEYLIEAESLPESRKWQMGTARAASGSTFLLATEKNATASGVFTFDEGGSFYIWVRNWSFSQKWRRVTIAVDGRKATSVGDEATTLDTPAWIWSKSRKIIPIAKGEHKIEIFADSASVRVDAVLLTTDSKYVPPEGKLPECGSYRILLPESDALKGVLDFGVGCDKAAIAYRVDEKIVFTFAPRCGGKAVTEGVIRYRLRGDDGQDASGEFCLTPQKNVFMLEAKLAKPGFLRLTADLVDKKGIPLRSIDETGKVYFAHFDGGAGAAIDRIPEIPEPENFDAFWTKQKARLDAVPLRAEVKKIASHSDEMFSTYAVTVDCAGNRPATGFLIVPVGAAPKSLKAQLHFEGYGTGIPAVPGRDRRQSDAMVFFVNAHGTPLTATHEEYGRFFAERKNYALSGNETPEKCYFLNMALRALRAAQYLAGRPEWNGVDLEVVGGSQGGLQSLWVAAQESRVSRCRVEVPWQCNCGGGTLGLMPHEWGIEKYTPSLEYFDAAKHARRIRCRVDVSRAGLGDYICPPSGVARMYYNLRCPKSIVWVQNSSHDKIPADAKRWQMEGEKIR
ncbi:MAG: acetylxylan esterase [Victivallaceae bacterium]|nr:acetylxylan esterase [Victivallaceae bacterium]